MNPSKYPPDDVEILIEIRGIYDGWSVAKMKDGSMSTAGSQMIDDTHQRRHGLKTQPQTQRSGRGRWGDG